MSMRAVVLTVALSAIAALGQPAASGETQATTDPAWGPVIRLAENPRGESLAVDAAGTVTVVWATSATPPAVVVRRHPAGGSWGKPVVVGHGYAPQVAADRRGTLTVAWLTPRTGRTDGVVAVRRPAGGAWSTPIRLTRDLSVPGYPHDGEEVYGATDLDLAVSPRGAVVAVWAWGSDARSKPWRIQSAYRPAGGPGTGPVDVTPASWARYPDVGIDARGDAVLVYGRQPFGHPQVLVSRARSVGGGWGDPVRVAREGYGHELAADRAGNAVVVFTPDFTQVRAVTRTSGGAWSPARRLSPAGVEVNDFAVAMGGPATAAVALGRSGGRVDLVRWVAGAWSDVFRVAPRGTPVSDVLVALDAAGDTFVGWGSYGLYGRYQSRDGTWFPASTISPDAGVEVLEKTSAVMAPDGDVAVLWKQEARPLKVRLTVSP